MLNKINSQLTMLCLILTTLKKYCILIETPMKPIIKEIQIHRCTFLHGSDIDVDKNFQFSESN